MKPSSSVLPQMSKFRVGSWLVGVCVVALVTLFTYSWVRGWTPFKVERTVNREIPLGSNRDRIETALDALGWPHRSYDRTVDIISMVRETNLDPSSLSGAIMAEVPEPNVGIHGVDKGTITVVFFLDRDGALVRTIVHVWIRSL